MEWNKSLAYYESLESVIQSRKEQARIVSQIIDADSLGRVEIIETGASQNLDDGCFGLFFAHLAKEYGGKFSSVDIDENISLRSSEIYKEYLPSLCVETFIMDSVDFLKNYDGSPTIVHLDSWDLNIYNPEPSMLHGFLEFLAIKDKMKSGSYIVVDDNFMQGTIIYWNSFLNGELVKTDEYTVRQEILGKGSMI